MRARMIHRQSENYGNVERFFHHKLSEANLKNGSLKFINTVSKEDVDVKADLIIGADGAFSSVRKSMMKEPLFDFSQKYIEHGGEFMMIALPNQDCSWTVTLFMPFIHFKSIDTEDKLVQFFDKYFMDSIPLIGKKKLIQDFFGDKALIIGDAAHAVVPFYGQGMNAGFEDCTLLDQLFQKYDSDLQKILPEFSDTRWEDTFAISDLAMYNYIEMRDLVTRPSYRIRKAVDDFIFWLFPNLWVPLYNSVTFSTMPYSHCVKNRQWQDKVLKYAFSFGVITLTAVFFFYYK
ncbi:Kynurenine 3-monooxygenase [Operophtera brumata]|uniref:Kynurenine 3-monooxygenase n=1 Tax=Operophtera brumata TaxID=104452 RepID=A0A0L7LI79_OPEBR|nr:Kynurenine 3-monooxygenase [Operophtera brumata]